MRNALFIVACTFALGAQGAWYWPFGSDEDGTNSPPRLHRLLEPATDYIELAQDASLDGDADKAIENYRLALAELDRVEAENPDRAASAEFAPLRARRVTCNSGIDAIRFAQINDNVRPVVVTDTSALQKKWDAKHGTKDKAAAKPEPPKPVAPPVATNAAPPKAEAPKPAPPKAEPATPKGWDDRIMQAMDFLRAKDYAGADVLLESMMNERPKDLNAMLLRAAAQAGSKNYYAAQRTLERAMRVHPKSYLPYYNLANLMIQQGEDLETAREYYELGRTVGGPENKDIESKLKGTGK